MIAILQERIAPPLVQFAKVLKIDLLLTKIVRLVSQLFRWISSLKKSYSKPNIQYKTPEVPVIPIPLDAEVEKRMAPYQNMPNTNVDFLRRSVALLRDHLRKKDINQLRTFNKQLENLEGEVFAKVLRAATRAFIFSGLKEQIEFFAHYEYVRKSYGDILEEINYIPQLLRLRVQFMSLPNDKKAIVLDEFDPMDVDLLDLPERGKQILRQISTISNILLERNTIYTQVFQAWRNRQSKCIIC